MDSGQDFRASHSRNITSKLMGCGLSQEESSEAYSRIVLALKKLNSELSRDENFENYDHEASFTIQKENPTEIEFFDLIRKVRPVGVF